MHEPHWVLEKYNHDGDRALYRIDANFIQDSDTQPVFAYVVQWARKEAQRRELPERLEVVFSASKTHPDRTKRFVVSTLRAGMDLIETVYAQENPR